MDNVIENRRRREPSYRIRVLFGLGLCLGLGLLVEGPSSTAQTSSGGIDDPELLSAWSDIQQMEYIDAREKIEPILRSAPNSPLGNLLMGMVHHFGEGDYPRALYYLRRAEAAFEERYGREPESEDVKRYHRLLLRQLAFTYGDLEQPERKLEYMDAHDAIYEPPFVAERAWPLMKLRRFREARAIAQEGIAASDPRQTEIALNALCGIEFEAGRDQESYEACNRAVSYARDFGQVNVVDLTNAAEGARSLFRFEEAERLLLQATQASVTWYGNPWLELGELYLRQGRFVEAVDALKRVGAYRAQRPPHVRYADLNDGRRVNAQLFLLLGLSEDALSTAEQARLLEDRSAHVSRDPKQDQAVIALILRQAELLKAGTLVEAASSEGALAMTAAVAEAQAHRLAAFRYGREAASLLLDDDRLTGLLRIGRAESGITPAWLVGDLVHVLGAGVMRRAAEMARDGDVRPGAPAYYDALLCEVAVSQGRADEARRLGTRAITSLPRAEGVLIARVHALLAELEREEGRSAAALAHYSAAFQRDPGVFRRLGYEVPIEVRGEAAAEVESVLFRSGRFTSGRGLVVSSASRVLSLQLPDGTVVSSMTYGIALGESETEAREKAAGRLIAAAFAPRVDLTQADIGSLDGSNSVSRNPIHTLFGRSGDD